MKKLDIKAELMRIKARLLDSVRDDLLRKLPKEDAEKILSDVVFEVDISFQALESLTNEILRSK
jgi:hypothetical protein